MSKEDAWGALLSLCDPVFLKQQIKAGKEIILSDDPSKAIRFFQQEVEYLEGLGYNFVQRGWFWKAIK